MIVISRNYWIWYLQIHASQIPTRFHREKCWFVGNACGCVGRWLCWSKAHFPLYSSLPCVSRIETVCKLYNEWSRCHSSPTYRLFTSSIQVYTSSPWSYTHYKLSSFITITHLCLPYTNHEQLIVMRIFVIFAIFSTAVMGLPNPSPNHHPKNTNPFPKPKAPLAPVCGNRRAGYTCGECVMSSRSCEQHTHCDRQGLLAVSSAPPGCGQEAVEEFCMLVDPDNNPQCRCVRGA